MLLRIIGQGVCSFSYSLAKGKALRAARCGHGASKHSPAIAEQRVRIDVHKDRLTIRFKAADGAEETSSSADDDPLAVPWRKPPSRRSPPILLPHGRPNNEARPTAIRPPR